MILMISLSINEEILPKYSKITYIANKIPFKKEEYEVEFEKACENSHNKNVNYLLSQYYLGPVLIWGLYIIVLITFAMINSGYSIGFETNSLIDSLIILIYSILP